MRSAPPRYQLSSTTQDAFEVYNSHQSYMTQRSYQDNIGAMQDQMRSREDHLLSITSNICTGTEVNLSQMQNHLPQINVEAFKNVLREDFYDDNLLKTAMCITDSIFYTPHFDAGPITLNQRIRMYITDLTRIDATSTESIAFKASFKGSKDVFVIKTARDPSRDNLQHELLVGLYGTNKLRKFIPNFAYIFGGFKCSPPIVDAKYSKVFSWCLNNNNAVNYVVYENIQGSKHRSISLKEYIKTCTGTDFLNVYMQVLYALRKAVEICDFTHYDLHTDNILLRVIGNHEFFQIEYDTERGQKEYIVAQVVATIIDYGYSHIKHKGSHYGRVGLLSYSVLHNSSWVLHDAYKLMMFSLRDAVKTKNIDVMNVIAEIFPFFNSQDDVYQALEDQKSLYYSYPMTQENNAVTIDHLTAYIRHKFSIPFISSEPRTGTKRLQCDIDGINLCLNEQNILNRFDIKDVITAMTINQYYDLATRISDPTKMTQLIELFNYEKAMRAHVEEFNQLVSTFVSYSSKLNVIDISTLPVNDILSASIMRRVRQNYILLASIIDYANRISMYKYVGVAVASQYKDENTSKYFKNKIEDLQKIYKIPMDEFLKEAAISILKNDKALDKIMANDEVRRAMHSKNLLWYIHGRKVYLTVFVNVKSTISRLFY